MSVSSLIGAESSSDLPGLQTSDWIMMSIHRYRIKCLGQKACCQFAVQAVWLNLNLNDFPFDGKERPSHSTNPCVVHLWQHKLGIWITVFGGNFCKLLSGYSSQCWVTCAICPSGATAVSPCASHTAPQTQCLGGWVPVVPLLFFRDDYLQLSLVRSCQPQVRALSFPGLSVD